MDTPQLPYKPRAIDFGLTEEQAQTIERDGGVSSRVDETRGRCFVSWVVCTIGIIALSASGDPTWFDRNPIGLIIVSGLIAWIPGMILGPLSYIFFPSAQSTTESPEFRFLSALKEYQTAVNRVEKERQFAVQWARDEPLRKEEARILAEQRLKEEQQREEQARILAEQRAKKDYWYALSGYEFERQLAELLRGLGYSAMVTPGSGDHGIDIDMTRDGKRVIVQCKAYKAPVGPGPVRDLYGTLLHARADGALMVALSGFTDGARAFAKGKPIHLRDVDFVVTLQSEVARKSGVTFDALQ